MTLPDFLNDDALAIGPCRRVPQVSDLVPFVRLQNVPVHELKGEPWDR